AGARDGVEGEVRYAPLGSGTWPAVLVDERTDQVLAVARGDLPPCVRGLRCPRGGRLRPRDVPGDDGEIVSEVHRDLSYARFFGDRPREVAGDLQRAGHPYRPVP